MAATTNSEPDPQTSGILCIPFCNGKPCPRLKQKRACPYVHDAEKHKEAIKRKKAAASAKKKATEIDIIGTKQQEMYNQDVATAGKEKVDTAVLTTAVLAPKHPREPGILRSVPTATNSKLGKSWKKTAMSKKTKPKDLNIQNDNQNAMSIDQKAKGRDIENNRGSQPLTQKKKPVARGNPSFASNAATNTEKELCLDYQSGYCWMGSECARLHTFLPFPKLTKKSRPIDSFPETRLGSSKLFDSSSDTESVSSVSSTRPRKLISFARALQKNLPKPKVKLPEPSKKHSKPWDWDQTEAWAKTNLSEATRKKFLATYQITGSVSTKLIRSTFRDDKPTDPDVLFPQFEKLSYDCKELIWLHVLENESNTCRIGLGGVEKDGKVIGARWKSLSRPPRLLQTCSDSRRLAKRYYELSFGTTASEPTIWFNWAKDRLYIQTDGAHDFPGKFKCLLPADADRLSSLLIPMRDWIQNRDDFTRWVTKLSGLKRFGLLLPKYPEDQPFTDKGKSYRDRCSVSFKNHWDKKYTEIVESSTAGKEGKKVLTRPYPRIYLENCSAWEGKCVYKIGSLHWGWSRQWEDKLRRDEAIRRLPRY